MPEGGHTCVLDAESFGALVGNGSNVHIATQIGSVSFRQQLWKGSKTMGSAYEEAYYRATGEPRGMFTRVGIEVSGGTLIYALNRSMEGRLSLKSQIPSSPSTESMSPTLICPALSGALQPPDVNGQIVIPAGSKFRGHDKVSEKRRDVANRALWRMYPAEVISPLEREIAIRQDTAEAREGSFRNGRKDDPTVKSGPDQPEWSGIAVSLFRVNRSEPRRYRDMQWESLSNSANELAGGETTVEAP